MRHILKRLYFYLCWPGLALYFAHGARSRVALMNEHGQLLLVQGKWLAWYDEPGLALPGGGMHRHEGAEAAAVREIAEELGVHLRETDLTLLSRERISEYGLGYDAYLFSAKLPADVTLKLQASEIVTAEWYSPEALGNYRLNPEVGRAVELLAPKS